MTRPPHAVRLYRALLGLLPRSVRTRDGDEIVATFSALWADAVRSQRRVRLLRRAFGGLAGAAVMEWWDVLRMRRREDQHWRRRIMDSGRTQFRHALRSLARTPSFALTAILLLGLGVGSVTAIFTLVDHVMLRELPYPHADRLFEVKNGGHSGPVFADLQQFRSVETWAAAYSDEVNLTGSAEPQAVVEARVSRDFFGMFGARPMLGRLLATEEFATGEGVVLSAGAWRRLFGSADDVVGRTIVLNNDPVVVTGVLADDFLAPEAMVGAKVDVWRPINPTAAWLQRRTTWIFSVVGRMAPTTSLAMVQQEADALAERRAREHPAEYLERDGKPSELPVETLRDSTIGEARKGLTLILGAVGLLLLVACTNVAHLFMARSLSRTREIAVRRALGANMRTIATHLLLESLLIGAGGALLGIALAITGVRAFLALNPIELPRLVGLAVDTRILLFACILGAATSLLFGLLPALRVAGRDVATSLYSRGRAFTEGTVAQRVRAALVVTEVALSIVLVAQAGLLLRSFARLHAQELGFRTDSIITLPLRITGIEDVAEWTRRMDAVRASLATVPGVRAATFGISMPLEHTGGDRCCWSNPVSAPGVDIERPAMMHPVGANYFDMFKFRFVAGAPWSATTEHVEPQPLVITEPVAIELFGSAGAALGRELFLGRQRLRGGRVVGVVEANRHYGHDQEPFAGVYLPASRIPFASDRVHMAVLLGPHGDGIMTQLRDAVWRVEPNLPVPTVRALEDWAGEATARTRFESVLFTTFGAVALMLVAGGLYGTLLYSVSRRRRELGIRLVLGDTPFRLERRVLGQGVRTTAAGSVFGLFGAWGFGRLLQNRLYGIEATDPTTFIATIALLLLVTMVASWRPARRAARTDPIEALQAD